MDSRGMIVSGVVFTSIFFLVASWFILLGGVSRVQHDCHKASLGNCRDRTGLYWWIIWFQFFALFLWPVVQFVEGLRGGRTGVIAIFAILATLQMISADNALDFTSENGFQSGYKCSAAGFIMLATFNLIAIMLLGFQIGETLDGDSFGTGGGGGGNTTTYNNPTANPKASGTSMPDNNPRPFRQASNAHGMNISQPNV